MRLEDDLGAGRDADGEPVRHAELGDRRLRLVAAAADHPPVGHLGGLARVVLRMLDELGVFFFQAEDGIRVKLVTGVQTCALPIYHGRAAGTVPPRSEERRVGKECRSRWSPYH